MGIEGAPPNGFRASMGAGPADTPVVAKKRARAEDGSGSLSTIKVARTESRSSNQRAADRHRLTDEQAVVRRKGKDHVVELINLSHGGAMVAAKFKAKLWDKVELVLGEASEIECVVRWMRDDRVGLEFAHETRVDCDSDALDELLRKVIRNSFPGVQVTPRAAPVVEEKPEHRLATRHPLIWSGILHHDYDWEVVRIRNISRLGALIECPVDLPVGTTVYLDLSEAGRLAANVKWSRGNQSGLEFHEPFDVQSLSKVAPDVAARQGYRPPFGDDGNSDQSPWAPQWGRLSLDELGASLGD